MARDDQGYRLDDPAPLVRPMLLQLPHLDLAHRRKIESFIFGVLADRDSCRVAKV